MPNTKPKFNKEAYKHAISMVESAGGKYLKNGNALGRYQFIYRYIKDTPEMRGVSKRQFMNDRELQEKIMDTALDGKLKNFTYGPAYAQKFIKENNANISIEDATALVHFLGPGDARKAIQNPDTFKVPGVNLTVDQYLGKFKKNYQRYQKHQQWMSDNQTEDNPIEMAYDKNGMAILREDSNPDQPYIGSVTSQENKLPQQPQQNIQGDPAGFSPEGVALTNLPDQSMQAENMPNPGGVLRIENQDNVPSLQDGFLRLEDQMKVQGLELTGQKSDPQEDRYQQNRYMMGGQMMDQLGKVGGNASAAGGGAEGAGGPGIGAYVGAAGAAFELGEMAFGKPDVDTSGMTEPEEVPSKGSAALNGAMKGASAGMAFGPWGAAIGGVVGGAAGIVGQAKAKKAEQKAHMNYTSRIHDQATNAYEYGGLMKSSDASPINGAAELVTMFENGGTHEQNSLGGIPQGMGSNGKPNLVEEGETKFEDYIFSNNIRMDGTIIDPEDTEDGKYKKGGMLKRADGSYSKRGLWDNIRANKGSGKKPTKQMLAQERKINKKEEGGELDPPTAWEQAMQKLKHYSDPVNAARLLTLGPIGESALSLGKSQIAGNINPVGYGTSVARKPTSGENTLYQDATSRHKGPISKFTNALVEPALGSANWTNKEGGPKKNIQPWELERQDLLNMLVNDGLPGSSGISVSNYRPSNSNKDSVYYNSPATEQSILNNLRENPDLLKQFKERNGIKTHVGYGLNTTQRTSDQGNVLGNYTMTLQKDKDGREYIDYSDVWDLQPFKTSKGATKITDAFQTAAGMKVPKVYGRVYLDQLNKKEEGGPLDPPTKEDPPSTWDKLKQTAQHYSKPENFIRAALLGPVGEMGLNYVKGRVAENINPVGYESPDEASVTQGPVGKLIDAVRRPQAGSAAWNEKGSDAWLSERQDLLNMMLNDDLPSGKLSRDGKKGIGVSAYKPSYAVDGTTYYDSPATKASIIETLKRDKKFLDNFKAGKDGVRTYTGYGLDDTESAHEQGNVLGNYRMTMGKDDNGDYIDYYDKWDLQPWKRTNKTLTKITDAAQRMAGVVTPEIYGRVYMNELEGNQKKYGGSLEDLAMMAPSKKKKTLKDLAALAKKKRKNK